MRQQRNRGALPSEYYYRRELSLRELLPAVGVGVAAGVVGFYVARLLLQRTPLARETTIPAAADARGATVRRPARRPAGA
jgi:hypothetical protein